MFDVQVLCVSGAIDKFIETKERQALNSLIQLKNQQEEF